MEIQKYQASNKVKLKISGIQEKKNHQHTKRLQMIIHNELKYQPKSTQHSTGSSC